MEIKFNCPHCFRKVGADRELMGVKVNCPNCSGEMTVPVQRFPVDTDINGFIIEQWLGSGNEGEVYLANQTSMDRQVALKIMLDKHDDAGENERFMNEARTLAKLDHHNIVTAFEAGNCHGYHYLAMSYVKGETVDERIMRNGTISETEATTICRKVASALDYAWDDLNILHRDIKPGNIMIDVQGDIRLMDMGIAQNNEAAGEQKMIIGTPYYMSPEQAGAKELDLRSDIYSLGSSLYHMVTGRPPFDGMEAMEIVSHKRHNNPKPVEEINPNLSDECIDLVNKMMAIDPEDRFQTWPECYYALKLNDKKAKKVTHDHIATVVDQEKVPIAELETETDIDVDVDGLEKKPIPLWPFFVIVIIVIAVLVFVLLQLIKKRSQQQAEIDYKTEQVDKTS